MRHRYRAALAAPTMPAAQRPGRVEQMKKMIELKPCPLCGGDVRFDKAYSYFRCREQVWIPGAPHRKAGEEV